MAAVVTISPGLILTSTSLQGSPSSSGSTDPMGPEVEEVLPSLQTSRQCG